MGWSMIKVYSNNLENLSISDIYKKHNANYTKVLRYYISISHKILDLHKEVSAPEIFLLQDKVDTLISSWDKKYDEYLEKQKLVAAASTADELTIESQEKLEKFTNILKHTLNVDDKIVWDKYKDFSKYQGVKNIPNQPTEFFPTPKPTFSSPKISFWQKITGKEQIVKQLAEAKFQESLDFWQKSKNASDAEYKEKLSKWEKERDAALQAFKKLESDFNEKQKFENSKIDELASNVEKGEISAVIEHTSLVLDASNYFDLFDKSFEIDYLPDDKLLIVDFDLPSYDKMPTIKSVSFVKSTGQLKETHISEKDKKLNFELACYQITLRTIHEIFEADVWNNIGKIAFNGYTDFIDKKNGKECRAIILSILTSRAEFEDIDLSKIDPKSCFKSLKGISVPVLSNLTPIQPIIQMDKIDRRFIEAKETIECINSETNLASMNWEDFEHLIREVFEKEFNSRGGEVKITQASNDGGVDAIAFDPDPILGGKVVIQAKRYTNTVGVSAVRDLYGTVQHEGASKGILVTTSDFGSDAHKFALDKPLTLISGSNLLYLLEKHGHKAKIDINEARQELGLKPK